ncbi:MAG: conserved phage C-terminal domain-containing protein [Chryseolinea sp.]
MHIKLDSAIRKEHWYPADRAFTEAEARIDLLLGDEKVNPNDPTLIALLTKRWHWKHAKTREFLQDLINEGFLLRDWGFEDEKESATDRRARAQEVVDVYNEVFGRRASLNDSRIRTINGRIKEGKRLSPPIGVKQFRAVFEYKKKEWTGTEHEKFLTLETLCRPSLFMGYLEAAREDHKKKVNATVVPKPEEGVRISGTTFR